MSEFRELEDILESLSRTIGEFPIGAVCINDLRPVEEKLSIARETLRAINSRLILLKTRHTRRAIEDISLADLRKQLDLIRTTTAATIVHNKAVNLCLHSTTIQSISKHHEGDVDMQKKMSSYMYNIFTWNDSLITMQHFIEEALQEQLDLKIQCQKSIFEYDSFLKEQYEIRCKKLQETKPEVAKNKEKMEKTIRQVNITKKLITNFIAASSHMLTQEPVLTEITDKHRELINVEAILKKSQNN